jgi:Tfp pilus assembly protein PilF
MLRLDMGDVEAALEDFKRVLEIKPEEWRAMREIGNVALQKGDCEAALESYRLALSYEERNTDLHVNAGLACSELGDVDGAIRHYERAIEIEPKHATAHNNLAAELARQNRLVEALAHAVSASTYGTDPDFAANRRMLEAATSAGAGSTTEVGL